jgi:hypothetical protein
MARLPPPGRRERLASVLTNPSGWKAHTLFKRGQRMRDFNVEVEISSRVIQTVRLKVHADNASQVKDSLKDWPVFEGDPNSGDPYISRFVVMGEETIKGSSAVKKVTLLDEEDEEDYNDG